MPTRYPQKNASEQIFLEHLQRAKITDRWKTRKLPSRRIQETHNPVWEIGRQICNYKTLLSRNHDVLWGGEKESTEEEGSNSAGEGAQARQVSRRTWPYGAHARCSGPRTLWESIFVSRTILSGVTRRAVHPRAARVQTARGASTMTDPPNHRKRTQGLLATKSTHL